MNWTSRAPLGGVKCIVETNSGCVFPAHFINGVWWNTEKAFPVDGVTRWIVYPEGEEPNDYIAPEALLKYVMQAYRESQQKLELTRDLNKQLVKEFTRMKAEYEQMKAECTQLRKQVRKGRTLQNNLRKLLEGSALLDAPEENQTDGQIVA